MRYEGDSIPFLGRVLQRYEVCIVLHAHKAYINDIVETLGIQKRKSVGTREVLHQHEMRVGPHTSTLRPTKPNAVLLANYCGLSQLDRASAASRRSSVERYSRPRLATK